MGASGRTVAVTLVARNVHDVHVGQVEQGVGSSAPVQARATRTVLHVEVFCCRVAWPLPILKASTPSSTDRHARAGLCPTSKSHIGPLERHVNYSGCLGCTSWHGRTADPSYWSAGAVVFKNQGPSVLGHRGRETGPHCAHPRFSYYLLREAAHHRNAAQRAKEKAVRSKVFVRTRTTCPTAPEMNFEVRSATTSLCRPTTFRG